MTELHRKQVRHVHEPGDLHELTFSCYQRRPLLTNDLWRQDLAEVIDRSCRRHQFGLLAYVFMPEHVHMLVIPLTSVVNLPRLLADIKRPTSLMIKQRLVKCDSLLLQSLTIRQRPGVYVFRFWQEGPGYDRNLRTPTAIQAAMNYIHENPVRRGLCHRATDWKWSSSRRLLKDDGDLSTPPSLYRLDIGTGEVLPPGS